MEAGLNNGAWIGGQHERASSELHPEQEEKTTMFVSKSINPDHNSIVEHKEASARLPGGRHKKRALELHLRNYDEEDDDDDEPWEEKEATFVAGADGAYDMLDMPKRIHLGYDVGVSSARILALDAEEERDAALLCRHRSLAAAMIRDMRAKAAMAKAAAAADPRTHRCIPP